MGIWVSNVSRQVQIQGRTYSFLYLEQSTDFFGKDFKLDAQEAGCSNSEVRTLIEEMPMLMSDTVGYDDPGANGEYLNLVTSLTQGGTDVQIDKIWDPIGPVWAVPYFEVADGTFEKFCERTLKAQWNSNFAETLTDNWAKILQGEIYSYLFDRNVINAFGQSAQRELEHGNYPEAAGLMWKDTNFFISACKAVLGIGSSYPGQGQVPGLTPYYHKSRLNLKGNLYTTKDGGNKVAAHYFEAGTGRRVDVCANAIFIYNTKPPTQNDREGLFNPGILVNNSFIVDLANKLTNDGEAAVQADLFSPVSSPPAGAQEWYNNLIELYNQWIAAFVNGKAEKWRLPSDYEASGIRLGGFLNVGVSTTSPGVLYVGARFAFGSNNVDGSLWCGDFWLEVLGNPRNALKTLGQVFTYLQGKQQPIQNRFNSNIGNKQTAAAAGSTGKTPTGLDGNGSTSTSNPSRDGVGNNNTGPVPAGSPPGAGRPNNNQIPIPDGGPPTDF